MSNDKVPEFSVSSLEMLSDEKGKELVNEALNKMAADFDRIVGVVGLYSFPSQEDREACDITIRVSGPVDHLAALFEVAVISGLKQGHLRPEWVREVLAPILQNPSTVDIAQLNESSEGKTIN